MLLTMDSYHLATFIRPIHSEGADDKDSSLTRFSPLLPLSHTHTLSLALSCCHSLIVLRELAVEKTWRASDGDTHFFVLFFLSRSLSRVDIFPPVPGFVSQVARFFPAHCVPS